MKLISWNVNGLRACGRSGFARWFEDQAADVVCLQEIKTFSHQLPEELLNPGRYHSYWHSAIKPGYSGVAILAKREPLNVVNGIGDDRFDREGRVLTAEFANFHVVSAYFPNSQRDHARLAYKLEFCEAFAAYCRRLRKSGKTLLVCGDFNIAHREIDLRNPKANAKNAGFLPEERAWMSQVLERDFVDAFRAVNPEPGHYTWWSYRPGVRARDIGWRLDYFLADAASRDRIKTVRHQKEVLGSDHCPVELVIKR